MEFNYDLASNDKKRIITLNFTGMKTTILLAVLIGISSSLAAQSGTIHGNVFSGENDEPMFAVNVSVIEGSTKTGASTDYDGKFIIKPLNPGIYSIMISFIGYDSIIVRGIKVYSDKITFIDDTKLNPSYNMLKTITIIDYVDKIIDPEGPSKIKISSDIILKTPGPKNPAMLARAYLSDVQIDNNQMIIRGSRPGSSTVYVDGVRMSSETTSLPSMAIGSMEMYTGGVPAKYGDVTGGVVILNTKSYFDLVNERRALEK